MLSSLYLYVPFSRLAWPFTLLQTNKGTKSRESERDLARWNMLLAVRKTQGRSTDAHPFPTANAEMAKGKLRKPQCDYSELGRNWTNLVPAVIPVIFDETDTGGFLTER